jgi:predicted heme/steroid binding protein
MQQRLFTRAELSRYNGKDGAPVYVACWGKVYDVSHSFLWQTGWHQVLHEAGTDLTGELEDAPHGVEMPEKFPVVGVLGDD